MTFFPNRHLPVVCCRHVYPTIGATEAMEPIKARLWRSLCVWALEGRTSLSLWKSGRVTLGLEFRRSVIAASGSRGQTGQLGGLRDQQKDL